MRWSEEVHVQRLVVARRAAGRQAQGISRASKADSSLSRLALVAGALASLVWWRKGGQRLCTSRAQRLPVVGPFLRHMRRQRKAVGRPVRSNVQTLAGDAAARRASQARAEAQQYNATEQASTSQAAPSTTAGSQQSQAAANNKRKNNKKKGRRR